MASGIVFPEWIIQSAIYSVIIGFIAIVGFYLWFKFGLREVYHKVFFAKNISAVVQEIAKSPDLKKDDKVLYYLSNPIISKQKKIVIDLAEIKFNKLLGRIEKRKSKEMQQNGGIEIPRTDKESYSVSKNTNGNGSGAKQIDNTAVVAGERKLQISPATDAGIGQRSIQDRAVKQPDAVNIKPKREHRYF